MIRVRIIVAAALIVCCQSLAVGAPIAGTDFSNTPVFNAPGGQSNLDNVNTDDLNPADGITVTNWSFGPSGKFESWDSNAQAGMANSPVTKLDGDSNPDTPPTVGSDLPTQDFAWFSIDIPSDTTIDLTTVTWDWRKATDGGNQRWLAFRTSQDSAVIFSELGLARNAVDNETITLTDRKYKGLTDQTIDFYWYAGGQGSGDIDIDTIIVNGAVVPEPTTLLIWSLLVSLGITLGWRRRKR